ncbi:ABC transporter of LPS O-antigen [Legionella wadsworthii]|uniref:ABC transporter of LPS O-antigen n=1 Tax=Legionella wadsworthii TaxID=28088 RepID=A0A378LPT1_9GAMM|nr:ABC transporter ATP-binding protein [Legionella wadsworthii]STY28946.1 ABC transporter of LPS O-antigen [Legionella wadsworthii]
MSSNIAIKVDQVSKCYRIYNKPHERLLQMIHRGRKQFGREFWALQDISFEVKKGETVGIIGRNGSGKSTLLQIICGILNPTSGDVSTNGRIAALLELGSGFNPEFTGRENVYLNATVLGLSREEIDSRYKDIVSFADIGNFIDQPVKTYSSGMFVRLAFSVAVYTNPSVLIIDEALSVGDIAFQNKCIEKIKELKNRGSSILFVSHDLSTMQFICDKVLWIKNGVVISIGHPVEICQQYSLEALPGNEKKNTPLVKALPPQYETGKAHFTSLRILNETGIETRLFYVGDILTFEFALKAESYIDAIVFAISIYRMDGDWFIGQTSREKEVFWTNVEKDQILLGAVTFPELCLAPGEYQVAFGAYSTDHQICYAITELCLPFSVKAFYQTWGKFIHPCHWYPLKSEKELVK